MLTVCGVHGSPFTRKVAVLLAEKNLPYEMEQVIPVNVSADYRKISPLGKVPCLKDGDFAVPDSSVICAYLEKKYPQPALYPEKPEDFARALWFEEYADTALITVLGGKIFFPKVIAPLVLKKPVDEAAIKNAVDNDVPPLFDYLEAQARDGKPMVGEQFSIADIAVTSHLLAFLLSGYQITAARWPKLAAYLMRNQERPSFKNYLEQEMKMFSRSA